MVSQSIPRMASNSLNFIGIRFADNIRPSIMIPQTLYTRSVIKDSPASIATTNVLSNQSTIVSIRCASTSDMYECMKPRLIET